MSFELNIFVRTAIVLLCSGLIVFALRGRVSAAARHTIWTIGLWATLMLPAASLMLPKFDVPVLPAPATAVFPEPIEIVAEEESTFRLPLSAPFAISSGWPWKQWLAIGWGLGSLVVLVRSLAGAWEVRRLRRNSVLVPDEEWQRLLTETQDRLGMAKPVELKIGNGAIPPMTWGVFRPVILMPSGAREWSAERKRLVLSHELAHVKRNDGWTQIVAQLACSVYWLNPVVWYAAYRMRIERERACDDCVLNLGASADDYADHLLQIARSLNSGFSFATVSMAHPSQLEARLLAILNPLTRRRTLSRVATVFLVICVAILTTSTAVLQLTVLAPMLLPAVAPQFVAFAAAPQIQPQQPGIIGIAPTQLSGLVTVRGSVSKLGSGEALPGTRVELVKSPPTPTAAYTTTTTADGKFVFSGVEPGEYRVVATRTDGLLPAEYGQTRPNLRGLPIEIRPGEIPKEILLTMAPPGAVSGRVFDQNGEPVGRAQVQALRTVYRDGRRIMTIAQSVHTNDLGEYRLFWLAPGQYFISARPEDGGARSISLYIRPPGEGALHDRTSAPVITRSVLENGEVSEDVYAPVYYPGTIDVQRASAIPVRPGDNILRMDITLARPSSARRVRGVVIDGSGGQPAAGAEVRAIPRETGPHVTIPNAVATERGAFEIAGVLPGSYYLFATPRTGGGFVGGGGRTFIDVGSEDLQNVTIVIPPPFDIPGRVIIEGKNDIDVTRVRINIRRHPDVMGMPFPQPPRRAGTSDPNAILPDATFALPGLGAGDYMIGASYAAGTPLGTYNSLTERTYLKSIRLGLVDVLRDGLHLDAKPEGTMEVVFGTTDGAIGGLVVNDKNVPVPNVRVVLIPEPALRYRTDLFRTTATNRSGRFDFTGVAPGDYKLFAWDNVEFGAWLDPEFLKNDEALGTPVPITEVSKETRQLTVIDVRR